MYIEGPSPLYIIHMKVKKIKYDQYKYNQPETKAYESEKYQK